MAITRSETEAGARVLTFLIADVRGYTAFTRERGDAAAARLATEFAALARDAVAARSGRVIELRGDEALAVFEDPAQAVRAAVELQAACAEASIVHPDTPVPVGIGIDVGEAVPVEDGFRGTALNMAARLCSTATAGQVVLRSVTADVIGAIDGVRFERRGTATLKGFDGPVDLIEATGEPATAAVSADRPAGGATDRRPPLELDASTALVGRDVEMQWLRGTWRRAGRGHGTVVFVAGPPGIGKTRLAAELASLAAGEGAGVRYAGAGGAAAANAAAAVREAAAADRPTLVVLDDLDSVARAAAQVLGQEWDAVVARPAMVLGLIRDSDASSELAPAVARADRLGDGVRALAPLDAAGVREVAREYAGGDVDELPLESMLRASGGVPGPVHELLSTWARDEAGRRLAAAAEWLASGRDRRTADLEFANNVIELRLDRLSRPDPAVAAAGTCPYKGLASFDAGDSELFFGRERLVGELAARTVGAGVVGVVGASGSGKSSVVSAGVIPSLGAGLLPGSEHWTSVTVRPGEHPVPELQRVLGVETVAAALGALPADGRLLLVVDQFEELFTLCADDAERTSFVEELARAAATPDRCCVLVAIRDDFYGRCASYPAFASLLAANQVLVAPMSREELRRAIELPARRVGLRVEGVLVDALVGEVADETGGLPLLSTALVELWQARTDGWIRREAYDRTGGVRGAVARLAEESFGRLEGPQREAARSVLLRLTGTGEGDAVTRRRVPLEEFDLDRDPAAAAVIRRFTEDRLLTASDATLEVAHEALLREWPRLRDWLAEDAQGRRLARRLTDAAKQWDASGREESELYRGATLSAALDWATLHGRELNQLERDYLAAGLEASEREAHRQRRSNRRLRGLLVGVAVFLVIALVMGGLALVQRSHARQSAKRAEQAATTSLANSLGAQGLIQPRQDRALLLAREAMALHPSNETKSDLLGTVLRSPRFLRELNFGDTGDRPQSLLLSPDGKLLAIPFNSGFLELFATPSLAEHWKVTGIAPGPMAFAHSAPLLAAIAGGIRGDIQLVDTTTHRKASLLRFDPKYEPYPVGGGGLSFSPDDRTLFVGFYAQLPSGRVDSVVDAYDVATGRIRSRTVLEHAHQLSLGASADGSRLVVVGERATFVIDAGTMKVLHRWPIAGSQSAAVSPDGRTLVLGKLDGSLDVVDLSTGTHVQALGGHTELAVGMGFSPDGSQLVTGGADRLVVVWDMTNDPPTVIATMRGHGGQVHGAATDGRTAYTASLDGTTFVWDMSGERAFGHQFEASTGDHLSPEFGGTPQPYFGLSPNGHVLAAPQGDGEVALWDLSSFPYRRMRTVQATSTAVTSSAFSPNGAALAVGSEGGDVRLVDPSTGSVRALGKLDGLVTGVAYRGAGDLVAASATACPAPGKCVVTVVRWDAASGRPSGSAIRLPVGPGFPSNTGPVAFSPDGRLLAVPVGNGTTAVLDAGTGRTVHSIGGSADVAAFSPNGRLVATTGFDGLVQLWDARTWRKVGRAFQVAAGFGASVSFDPTGRFLVTGSSGDDTVKLFDISRPGRATPFGAPSFPTTQDPEAWVSAQFTGDGSAIVVVESNGEAWVWPMRWQEWASHACAAAGRQLSRAEWSQFVPGRPYANVCPSSSEVGPAGQ